MNLESALKRLAECEPGKFGVGGHPSLGGAFLWEDGAYKAGVAFDLLSQDDLDEIAALIGWEYEVRCFNRTDHWWGWEAWGLGGAEYLVSAEGKMSKEFSKLEAAKSALIAIIESQYPKGR